jgi:uncharacterized membrane protein
MHIIPSIIWIGSVYMGTFIDWPVCKDINEKGRFPYNFIVGQGKKVYYSVYLGIILLWCSGIALIFLSPTDWSVRRIVLIIIKTICLSLMTGFTLYGTLVTWPKLQLSTNDEAYKYYRQYMRRATGTFVLGIIATITGIILR